FFSSRRRHTRFSRDWSSDVCSSDLDAGVAGAGGVWGSGWLAGTGWWGTSRAAVLPGAAADGSLVGWSWVWLVTVLLTAYFVGTRSEERRVGKEGRCGCSS